MCALDCPVHIVGYMRKKPIPGACLQMPKDLPNRSAEMGVVTANLLSSVLTVN